MGNWPSPVDVGVRLPVNPAKQYGTYSSSGCVDPKCAFCFAIPTVVAEGVLLRL